MLITNTTKNELCNELRIIKAMDRNYVNCLKWYDGKHIQKKYSTHPQILLSWKQSNFLKNLFEFNELILFFNCFVFHFQFIDFFSHGFLIFIGTSYFLQVFNTKNYFIL